MKRIKANNVSLVERFNNWDNFIEVVLHLIPLGLTLVGYWDFYTLLMVFWYESIVIGAVCILRLIMAQDPIEQRNFKPAVLILYKWTLVFKYIFQYSFLLILAFFPIYFMFGKIHMVMGIEDFFANLMQLMFFSHYSGPALYFILFSFLVSHLVSFYTHYYKTREYRKARFRQQMNALSRRLAVLLVFFYLVILFSMIVFLPTFYIILFFFFKLLLEIKDNDGKFYFQFYKYN
ncbi:MAG: DUF6498-containing protein [Cytophagaceae bacterium]